MCLFQRTVLCGFFLLLPAISENVHAQADPSDAAVCASIEARDERLDCYDRIFRDPALKAAAVSVRQPENALEPMDESQPADIELEEAFGLYEKREAKSRTLEKIDARVVRIARSAQRLPLYYLDNEQVWRQTTDRPFTLHEGDRVQIEAGRFGSFSLVNERKARTSVERVR